VIGQDGRVADHLNVTTFLAIARSCLARDMQAPFLFFLELEFLPNVVWSRVGAGGSRCLQE